MYVHLLHLHSSLRNVARVDPDAGLADPAPVQTLSSPPAASLPDSQEQKRLAEERQRILSVIAELSRVANSLREKQKESLGELKQAALPRWRKNIGAGASLKSWRVGSMARLKEPSESGGMLGRKGFQRAPSQEQEENQSRLLHSTCLASNRKEVARFNNFNFIERRGHDRSN